MRRGTAVAAIAVLALAAGVVGASAAPNPDIATVRRQVEALQEEAEAATETYNGTREKLKTVTVLLQAATSRVDQQTKRVEEAREALGRLAAETYKAGDLQALNIFLDDDPQTMLAATGLRSTLSDRQAEAVAALVTAQKQLNDDQAELAAQRKQLTEETARLSTLKKQVQTKLSESRRLLSRLDGTQRQAITRVSHTLDREALEKLGITVPANGMLDCTDVGVDAPNARAQTAISFACAQLGKPYLWGGDGPGSYDCSGLTMAAWGRAGVSLPHNAAMQARYGTHVSAASLQPGDLLFFNGYNHMGMYLGKGLMIHAPRTGDVIRVAPARLAKLISAVRL
jgi:cell wall-associated NlpC family hydrolase